MDADLAPTTVDGTRVPRGVRSTAAGISLLERVPDVAKLLAERQTLVVIEH